MPSELLWTTMECFTTYNSWLGTFPIKVNKKTRPFESNKNHKELLRYYFNIFYCCMCLDLGSILILIVRNEYFTADPKFTFLHYVIFLVVLLVQLLVIGVAIFYLLFGEEMIAQTNAFFVLTRKLDQGKYILCIIS